MTTQSNPIASGKFASIAVTKLRFDPQNPRFEVRAASDRESLETLFEDSRALLALAADVARNGLSPIEVPVVTPKGSNYLVLEGNRRLAALAALRSPTRVKQWISPTELATLKTLGAKSALPPGLKLRCYVVQQREDADHWIRLRHEGRSGGLGRVAWSPKAQARHAQRSGRSSSSAPAVKMLDWLVGGGAPALQGRSPGTRVHLQSHHRYEAIPHARRTPASWLGPDGCSHRSREAARRSCE